MPIHHIACIHGIGKHADDWANPANAKEDAFGGLFAALWTKYPQLKAQGGFAKRVQIHSIHYDDELEEIFKSWEKQVKALKDGLASSPLLRADVDWFISAMDKASAAKNDANWAYTHLLDLLLFVGSPSIQDRIVVYVGKQLTDLAVEFPNDEISVVAHSMGCAVAHKAIQAMFNEAVNGQTLRGDFRFSNVCMIANTSYSLSRDRANHYNGIVRPSLTAGRGCCTTWINVNHQLDPVGLFQRFDYRKEPSWLDPRVDQRHWHRDIPLSLISTSDIHSITHYFRDPSFHIPYFELVLGAEFDPADRDKAVDAFEKQTPQGQFKSLRSHLETLDTSRLESFKDLYEALRTFFALMKQFDR